jgi:hypothetical protein
MCIYVPLTKFCGLNGRRNPCPVKVMMSSHIFVCDVARTFAMTNASLAIY